MCRPFDFRVLRHRGLIWLAVFAVLLGALAPIISTLPSVQAASAPHYDLSQDLCGHTAQPGTLPHDPEFQQWLASLAPAQSAPHELAHGASCAYCVFYAGQFSLPPPERVFPPHTATGQSVPVQIDSDALLNVSFPAFFARGPPVTQLT